MAAPNSDIALLTEHFGYPPVSLIDEIINSVNFLAERAVGSVEKGLQSQPPANLGFRPQPAPPATKPSSSRSKNTSTDEPAQQITPEDAARHEIENGTHQLETLLFASVDRSFDKFEIYVMRNILSFRPTEPKEWIRLSHYEGLDLDQSTQVADEDRPSMDSVRRLRRRLQASQQLNVMLHAERARNEGLLQELRGLLGGVAKDRETKVEETQEEEEAEGENGAAKPPFGFLHDQGELTAGGTDKPLETTTAFTLSQMQALRTLSTTLRSLLPDLAGKGRADEAGEDDDGGDPGRKSWRRERLEYVEAQTKKHLEQERGLELGPNGEVRDGEWQGEGRNLATGEVESLERVAALLGAAAGAAGSGDGQGDEMDES